MAGPALPAWGCFAPGILAPKTGFRAAPDRLAGACDRWGGLLEIEAGAEFEIAFRFASRIALRKPTARAI
jgi:hypothetical protein